MADEKQLELIRQGPTAWNQWRRENPTLTPELSEADLKSVDLRGANLTGANLAEADLSGARLTEARLRSADVSRAKVIGADLAWAKLDQANLGGANLSGANLGGANLSRANLYRANLIGVRLADANLDQANFIGATLAKANLLRAVLFYTVFGDTNLTGALGLDECHHLGPSILDYLTLAQSGQLPLSFLRGCGLPDTLITYLPSLLTQAIQYYSCFISYSTKDQEFAERLYADLQNKGVRCWFAPHDVQGGKKLHEQIDAAIRVYDRLLLILSEASMHSEWVKTEISKARKRERSENRRMLFPVRLVDFETLEHWECFDADAGKDSAREIREYYVPDFSNWKNHDSYQKEFARLLRDLKTEER